MKKKIIFIFIFVFMLFLCDKYSIRANAVRKDDFDIYIETGPALEKKKVYLTDEMVYFLKGSNLKILDEPEYEGGETIHHFYYMASRYIDEIVYYRKLDNSMDSLVYIVKQLEFYAADYKLDHKTSKTVNDLVLGYLRCINRDYSEASSLYDGLTEMGFSILCGSYEEDFIIYVKELEEKKKNTFSVNITIPEFLGRYVNGDKFNQIYGEYDNSRSILRDPITKMPLDVPHFFCVIDGLRHVNKDFPLMMGFHMISWLGDLHQATCCRNVIRKMYEPFDFQTDVLYTPDSSFEIDDFIADVDGFNIGFGLSTNKDNSELKVSDFINAYYEIIRQNPKNRYRFFIKFVSFDAENIATNIIPSSDIKWYVDLTKNTGENGFKFIVCVNMGVACDTYNDVPADFYYNEYNPLFKFLCKKGDENRCFPCVELRANMAREFIEYVFEKAA